MEGRIETKRNKALYLIRIGIMLLMVITAMPMVAHGAGNFPKVTVSQVNSSAVPKELSFIYVLKPRRQDNPMPVGSTEEGLTFPLIGNSTIDLIFSENIREGFYIYDLYQVRDEKNINVIYDQRIYRLELFIDEGGEATLIVFSKEGLKVDEIKFENDFKKEVKPPPPPPEDDPKPEDPKPEDPKPEDPKPEDPKPEDPKPEDPKPKEPTPGKPSTPGKAPITGDSISLWLGIIGAVLASKTLIIVFAIKKGKGKKREVSEL